MQCHPSDIDERHVTRNTQVEVAAFFDVHLSSTPNLTVSVSCISGFQLSAAHRAHSRLPMPMAMAGHGHGKNTFGKTFPQFGKNITPTTLFPFSFSLFLPKSQNKMRKRFVGKSTL
jgi:hypothetical protein